MQYPISVHIAPRISMRKVAYSGTELNTGLTFGSSLWLIINHWSVKPTYRSRIFRVIVIRDHAVFGSKTPNLTGSIRNTPKAAVARQHLKDWAHMSGL